MSISCLVPETFETQNTWFFKIMLTNIFLYEKVVTDNFLVRLFWPVYSLNLVYIKTDKTTLGDTYTIDIPHKLI
jgi:hypothetical protein